MDEKFNLSDYKTETAFKNAFREYVFGKLTEILSVEFGSDKVSIVGNNTLGIGVDYTDKDGFLEEICFEIKPVVKPISDKTTDKRKTEKYDRLTACEQYNVEKSEKEKAIEEKAKAKAEKIERDKKAREQAKENKA